MKAPPIVAAALLAVTVSACGGSSPAIGPNPSFSPNPKRSELIVKADLDPCPASRSTTVTGGLPDITLPCLGKGPAVHLGGVLGKPLVVNIWGSWCGPCQKEAQYFAQVYDTLKTKVQFLGVDDEDDPDSALDFAPHVRPPMRYPSVVDEDKRVLIALHGPIAVPSTVFVDSRGKVVRQVSAPYSSAAQLRADIAHYLGVSS